MGLDRTETLVVVHRPFRRAWRGLSGFGRACGWVCLGGSGVLLVLSVLVVGWSAPAQFPSRGSGVVMTYWVYACERPGTFVAVTQADIRRHGDDRRAVEAVAREAGVTAVRPMARSVMLRDDTLSDVKVGGWLVLGMSNGWSFADSPYADGRPLHSMVVVGSGRLEGIPIRSTRAWRFAVASGDFRYEDVERLEPGVWNAVRDATERARAGVNPRDLHEGELREVTGVEWAGVRYLMRIARWYLLGASALPAVVWLALWCVPLGRGYRRLLRGHCPRCDYPLAAAEGHAYCSECGWQHPAARVAAPCS
ncbi:MAG: hypothetical protein U0637_10160 [Phycisphaerales bacterium]